MINRVEIKNFKSISNLIVDLGRVNVVIGENGCGKTNFLESLAFASAACQNNLNSGAISSKLRVVPKDFMYSAFEEDSTKSVLDGRPIIEIKISENNKLPTLISCTFD